MVEKTIESNFSRTDDELLTTTNTNYSQGRLVEGSSTPDVIVADTNPGTTVLVDQQQITVELDHDSNSIVNPTFQLGTTASKTIVKGAGSPLDIGDTGGNGSSAIFKYSLSLDFWVLLNPAANPLYGSLAEALAGSDRDGSEVSVFSFFSGEEVGAGVWDVVLTSGVTPNTFDIQVKTSDPSLSLKLRIGSSLDLYQIGLTNSDGDMTALVQHGLDICETELITCFCYGNLHPVSTVTVRCSLVGNGFSDSGGDSTFTSSVTTGVYIIVLADGGGSLENIGVRNTSTGNGINCAQILKTEGLFKVSAATTQIGNAGSAGSIGVNFGDDSDAQLQPLTNTFKNVISRNYDIAFDFKFFSNTNVYENFYALNTTSGSGTESSIGFKSKGRGATFIKPICESNFLESYKWDEQSEHNTLISPWTEGSNTQAVDIQGVSNVVISPFGFAFGTGNYGPYTILIGNTGPALELAAFQYSSENLIKNSGFNIFPADLNWNNADPSGNTILDSNSIEFTPSGGTGVTSDHLMDYVDIERYRGKVLTYYAMGQATSGVTMTIRAIIRTSGGSNPQYGTSEPFSDTEVSFEKVSFVVPEDPDTSTTIVFRIVISGGTDGVPAGEIALPCVMLGKNIDDMKAKPISDTGQQCYGDVVFFDGTGPAVTDTAVSANKFRIGVTNGAVVAIAIP